MNKLFKIIFPVRILFWEIMLDISINISHNYIFIQKIVSLDQTTN